MSTYASHAFYVPRAATQYSTLYKIIGYTPYGAVAQVWLRGLSGRPFCPNLAESVLLLDSCGAAYVQVPARLLDTPVSEIGHYLTIGST